MGRAQNVYSERGRFKPHKDHEALTVLVPLNDEESFSGGGTAFWSAERVVSLSFCDTTVGPDLVLLPPAGSALIFAGCVTHAAVAVTRGERCILVASFSPLSPGEQGGEAVEGGDAAPAAVRQEFEAEAKATGAE